MQQLTAAPREHLTEGAVRALIERAPYVDAGLDVLDSNLRPQVERSALTTRRLRSCTVSRQFYATIHGTCQVALDLPLRWGLDYVRPYTVLSDGTTWARFDLGVYVLGLPRQQASGTAAQYEVTGLDPLSLLDRPIGAAWVVIANTPVLQAVEDAISTSGLTLPVLLDSSARAALVPDQGGGFGRVWDLVPETDNPDQTDTPVTWLRVVNDLLRMVNYRGLYSDPATGAFRSEPYRKPADRAAEWEWTDLPAVGVAMSVERERIGQAEAPPNRWVVISNNPPQGTVPHESNGYVRRYDLPPEHPQSAANRNGLIWPRVYKLDAASPDALQALLERQVQTDLSFTTRFEHATRHFPLAGHADVYRYSDGELGISEKVQAIGYTVDAFGADTRWTWEAAA